MNKKTSFAFFKHFGGFRWMKYDPMRETSTGTESIAEISLRDYIENMKGTEGSGLFTKDLSFS